MTKIEIAKKLLKDGKIHNVRHYSKHTSWAHYKELDKPIIVLKKILMVLDEFKYLRCKEVFGNDAPKGGYVGSWIGFTTHRPLTKKEQARILSLFDKKSKIV